VNIPLLRWLLRSVSVMPESRLSSSISSAFCLHWCLNSHSGQCRLRISSGGELLLRRVSIFSVTAFTSLANSPGLTVSLAWLSPEMMLPTLILRPSIWDKASASNANESLSCLTLYLC
jgi:hypothetical protein